MRGGAAGEQPRSKWGVARMVIVPKPTPPGEPPKIRRTIDYKWLNAHISPSTWHNSPPLQQAEGVEHRRAKGKQQKKNEIILNNNHIQRFRFYDMKLKTWGLKLVQMKQYKEQSYGGGRQYMAGDEGA